jgi:hypothetical protein
MVAIETRAQCALDEACSLHGLREIQHFRLDEAAEDVEGISRTRHPAGKMAEDANGLCDEDRLTLEASKVSFLKAVQEQQRTDATVQHLLRKLDALPVVELVCSTASPRFGSLESDCPIEEESNNEPTPEPECDDEDDYGHEDVVAEAALSKAAPMKGLESLPVLHAAEATASSYSSASDSSQNAVQSDDEVSKSQKGFHDSRVAWLSSGRLRESPTRASSSSSRHGPASVSHGSKATSLEPLVFEVDKNSACDGDGESWLPALGSEDWCGWIPQVTSSGDLFYHHSASGISQWHSPCDLICVLGEWDAVENENGEMYWWNEGIGAVSWTDPASTTNIFCAARAGDMCFVKLYVHCGGLLNISDEVGQSPLHYACASCCSSEMISFLLRHGAVVEASDVNGLVPLHLACGRASDGDGSVASVKMLLDSQADPDAKDKRGYTPMHYAAGQDSVGIIRWLALAGASPVCRSETPTRRTPAEVAADSRSNAALALLRECASQPFWLDSPSSRHCGGGGSAPGEASESSATWRPSLPSSPLSFSPTSSSPTARAVARVARPLLYSVQWLVDFSTRSSESTRSVDRRSIAEDFSPF